MPEANPEPQPLYCHLQGVGVTASRPPTLSTSHSPYESKGCKPDVRVVVALDVREALAEVGDGREEVHVERDVVFLCERAESLIFYC